MIVLEHAAILVVVIPLLVSFFNVIIGLWKKNLCYPMTVLTLGFCLILTVNIIVSVIEIGTFSYRLGGWTPPWGIEYVIDHLNAYIAIIVSFISFIFAIYSRKSIEKEISSEKIPYFYTLYLLLAAGLLGITLTGDLFNIFVFLEITSLSAYALIAIGDENAPLASFNYLIMGTIGACFYLLGVGYLYISTGSLNIADLAGLLPGLYHSKTIIAAFGFFIVGIAVKIAFFPFHIWLPDAYTHAPSAVSAFVASTMTKVGAYVMIRIMYTVFEPRFSTDILPITAILGWIAAAAIIFGSILALAQKDIKRILSYIIIAEVGYIVMGVSIANKSGFTGAVLHIMNDALMMACLFSVAGAIIYRTGSRDIYTFGGLGRKMPFTMAALFVSAVSIAGLPPTAGFFSKWYLLLGTIYEKKWIFAGSLIFSSLVNAVIFFRILEIVYFKKHPQTGLIKEVPMSMLIPILITAGGILITGFYSGDIISSIIRFAVPREF